MTPWAFKRVIAEVGRSRFDAWTKVRKGTAWKADLRPEGCELAAARGDKEAQVVMDLFKTELMTRKLKS